MVFCSVCFGDPLSPLTQGYNFGILSLLTLTLVVLFSFGALFLNIRKKSFKNRVYLQEKGLV
jgi:hypothetical protein